MIKYNLIFKQFMLVVKYFERNAVFGLQMLAMGQFPRHRIELEINYVQNE